MAKSVKKGPRAANGTDRYIGERIREARNASGKSQDELGKALGVTFQQVQKYEKGVNRVSVGRIQQIAATTGKPVSFFLNESDDPRAKADPNITRLLTTKEGYQLANSWFAASPSARKCILDTLKQFVREGA